MLEEHLNREYDQKIRNVAEFAVPFAYAIVKLKKAFDVGEGVTLTHEELSTVIDAMKLLSGGVKT